MNITRDVIIDLWPAYQAGEVSPETRALVDEFLAADPEFASILRKVGDARRLLQEPAPTDEARSERKTMEKARSRLIAQWMMLGTAVLTTGMILLLVLAVLFLLGAGRLGVPGVILVALSLAIVIALAGASWWGFSRVAKD